MEVTLFPFLSSCLRSSNSPDAFVSVSFLAIHGVCLYFPNVNKSMKRKFFYGLLLTALALNLFVGAQVYIQNVSAAEKDDPYPNLKLFSTVLERVRQDYVDGDKVTYQELIQGAMKGMLNTLDPHSEFMESSKYDELKKDTQGEFGGVGIVISMKDGHVAVVAPMEDTPGYKAGILSGDRIIKIDGRSTEKFSIQDAVKKLRGEPGSKWMLPSSALPPAL